jgi:hypothetical protein
MLYLDMLSEEGGSLLVRNNLAMTLAALGQSDAALEHIDLALALAGDSPLREELLNTQRTILGTSRGTQN